MYFVPFWLLLFNLITPWPLASNTRAEIFLLLWFKFWKGSLITNQLKSMGKLKNFSQAFQPWNPHLSIYLYTDLVIIWSWFGFSGNFAMIYKGNVFTVFDLIQFCMKQSRQNSWAKWRLFQALTSEKICMLLNIPVLIGQKFDFGTIISGQVLSGICSSICLRVMLI